MKTVLNKGGRKEEKQTIPKIVGAYLVPFYMWTEKGL